jgi:hypothetical protein
MPSISIRSIEITTASMPPRSILSEGGTDGVSAPPVTGAVQSARSARSDQRQRSIDLGRYGARACWAPIEHMSIANDRCKARSQYGQVCVPAP